VAGRLPAVSQAVELGSTSAGSPNRPPPRVIALAGAHRGQLGLVRIAALPRVQRRGGDRGPEREPRLGGWRRRVVTSAMPPQSPRPWKRKSSRRRVADVGVAAVILVAVLAVDWTVARQRPGPTRPAQAGATSSSAPTLGPSTIPRPSRHGALPLGGVPLVGPTGLRLLIADGPAPFVLDVDQGTIRPIAGLPSDGERGVTVLPVGNHALVLSFRLCTPCRPGSSMYLVRHGSTAAMPLGTTLQVVPSRDGQGLWLLSSRGAPPGT
jgi:hypothetical protein